MSDYTKAAEALREHSIELGCAGPHGLEEVFALAARVLAAVEKVERMKLKVIHFNGLGWHVQPLRGVTALQVKYHATFIEAVEAVPEPAALPAPSDPSEGPGESPTEAKGDEA